MKNISSKKNSTLTRLNEWTLLSDPGRSKWKIIKEVQTGQSDSHLCQLEQLLVEMIKHTSSKRIKNSGNCRIVKAQEDEYFEHIELLWKKVLNKRNKKTNKITVFVQTVLLDRAQRSRSDISSFLDCISMKSIKIPWNQYTNE